LVKLFEISDKAFNLIDTQYTDNDGFYIFDKVINKPKVSFQLKISFVNDALKLIDGKNILYEFDMPMIENVTDSSINADCIFNEENQYRVLGHIFNCINDAHTFLLDNLSWSRKLINVKYPYKADNSKYTYIIFIGGKMINEIINIATNRAWNRTSMLHEYGHAVMTALYDYNYYVLPKDDFRGDPDANYSHSVYTISEEGFAMKEGWAEFFEALIDDNAFNRPQWKTSNTPNIEYNEWWKGIEKNNIKGELVEGAVASILWDIADTADSKDEKPNIDDDKINGRLNDLWNLIAKYKPSSILEIWNYWIDLDYGQIQSLYYIYKSNGVKTIMPYDLNSDGKIDVADMIIVGSYLGKSVTGSINLSPDINKDNKVDVLDILKVGKNMDQ